MSQELVTRRTFQVVSLNGGYSFSPPNTELGIYGTKHSQCGYTKQHSNMKEAGVGGNEQLAIF